MSAISILRKIYTSVYFAPEKSFNYPPTVLRRRNISFSPDIVSLQVKGRCFAFFHPAWSTCRSRTIFATGWRKLPGKVERGSTFSNTFWLCYSFVIKLATCFISTSSKSTNQRAAFFSTHNRCSCCATSWSREVKNEKHRPKTCNETMLLGKLRVFVFRISPPLMHFSFVLFQQFFKLQKQVFHARQKHVLQVWTRLNSLFKQVSE